MFIGENQKNIHVRKCDAIGKNINGNNDGHICILKGQLLVLLWVHVVDVFVVVVLLATTTLTFHLIVNGVFFSLGIYPLTQQ
mmetsp:Transcript_63540/g.71028  ORF Transcript_63540/g.71028 Transcript_63540/m.71028 type:complete len:82 (+) Transcript_63540:64-309(+)